MKQNSSDEEWVDAPIDKEAEMRVEKSKEDLKQEESKEEEEQPKLGESEQSDPSEEEIQTTFGSGIVQNRDGKLTTIALPFGVVFLPENATIIDLELAKEIKAEGNDLFRAKEYQEALGVYSKAYSCVPPNEKEFQSILLGNRAACLARLEKWDEVVSEASESLALNPEYVKVLARRAEAYEKLKKYQDAIADWKEVDRLDPNHRFAKKKLRELKPLAEAEFEKQKEEVMGQVKDLGNKVLGWFGMSVDDFGFEQDPATGSYSINMKNR